VRACEEEPLVATCVSCGATAHDWDERVREDAGAELRITMSESGPVLHVLFCDACQVCGGPEVDVRTWH